MSKSDQVIMNISAIVVPAVAVFILLSPGLNLLSGLLSVFCAIGVLWLRWALKYDWNFVQSARNPTKPSGRCRAKGNHCFTKTVYTGLLYGQDEIILNIREYNPVSAYHGLWNVYSIPWAGITVYEDRKKIRNCWYVSVD